MNLKYVKLLVVLVFLISGCATVNVPDLGKDGYKVEEDERRLRKRSDEASEILNESDYIYNNKKLENYLNKKAQEFLSQYPYEYDVDFYVRVLAEPNINAFAAANGNIYFHTGLIALTESEAQLVSVLAHEIVHVLERHHLKSKRSIYNKAAFMSTFGGLGVGGVLLQFGGLSSIYGYSRDLEQQADLGAFKMLRNNGYDVNEMPKFYKILSDNLIKQGRNPNYFFSTHPKVRKRIKIYSELINDGNLKESKGIVTSDEFESFIDEIVYDHIRMCLEKGYFELALSSANRMEKKYPQTPEPYFYKGEVYRQWQNSNASTREKESDFQKAIKFYKQVIEKDKNYADAYKGLGNVYQRQENHAQAVQEYKTYLSFGNESSDAAYIQNYLKTQGSL